MKIQKVILFFFFEKVYGTGSTTGTASDIGHFTQIVWSETTHVGCAEVQCTSLTIVACNYGPGYESHPSSNFCFNNFSLFLFDIFQRKYCVSFECFCFWPLIILYFSFFSLAS